MKIPVVKEWGSWAVFSSSCLAGLITGFKVRPWLAGREFAGITVLTILGLACLINSKNPLASALRSGGKKEHVLWSLFFMLSGLAQLMPFLIEGTGKFLIFTVLVISYFIFLSMGKEHHIITELNGFSLLTIAAPVIYFTMTGEMSFRLYAAVTIFFAAGVFKVRMRLRKTFFFRFLMAAYCAVACLVFYVMNISVVLLLPLLENLAAAVWMRDEKLKATGYTELAKGVLFIILIGLFWN